MPAAAISRDRPDPASLRKGDLLWPKLPGTYIPFGAAAAMQEAQLVTRAADEALWRTQRDALVGQVQHDLNASEQQRAMAHLIAHWTYRDFLTAQPLDGKDTTAIRLWVGHVGLVDIREGVPWVIDATPSRQVSGTPGPEGVAAQTYAEWLDDDSRKNALVWHGRVKNVSLEQADAMVAAAAGQIGKPYCFVNFNLLNASGFYCSKLIWFAVWHGLRQALDGVTSAERWCWFTPVQAIQSPLVELLSGPSGQDYGGSFPKGPSVFI